MMKLNLLPFNNRRVPGVGENAYHVMISGSSRLSVPENCTACGSTDAVLTRRLETKAARPGVHFITWAGRPLRLPLCAKCGTQMRNRMEFPLAVWCLGLVAALGLAGFAFGGRLLPFAGAILTSMIAIPIWIVRRWQSRRPLPFDVTDYEDQIDFEWNDYDRAAEFAALNNAEVVG